MSLDAVARAAGHSKGKIHLYRDDPCYPGKQVERKADLDEIQVIISADLVRAKLVELRRHSHSLWSHGSRKAK